MADWSKGMGSGGAFAWFFQRVTGAILLITLLVHFWVLHFFPPPHGEVTYQAVMERLANPVWRAFDLLFLVAAIYHGMNGALLVIRDYVHTKGLKILITAAIWTAALYFLIVGSMTILGLA